MQSKIIFASIVVSLITFTHLIAQGVVNVNHYTGAAHVTIPIWNIKDHDISLPIALTYQSAGVKVGDVPGWVGMGWSLRAGGVVIREVRGLPDDYIGTGDDLRKGWLEGTVAQTVGNLNLTSDNDLSTCSDEYAEWNTLSGFGYTKDTEPDIFSVNIAGMSFRFVFGNNKAIHTIPFNDLEITYNRESNGKISAFTIKNNLGFKYTFDQVESITSKIVYENENYSDYFFKRNFELNKGEITYNSAWKLSEITSPSGASLFFSYKENIIGKDLVKKIKTGVETPKRIYVKYLSHPKIVYRYESTVNQKVLTSIHTTSGLKLDFNSSLRNDGTSAYRLNDISVFFRSENESKFIKQYDFEYKYLLPINPPPPDNLLDNTRMFLWNLTEKSSCASEAPYTFSYFGKHSANYTLRMPLLESDEQDFWGYYNRNGADSKVPRLHVYPNAVAKERYRLLQIPDYADEYILLDGNNREVNPVNIISGTLSAINYPSGSTVVLFYEPHEYYDPTAQANVIGGGIRVRQTIFHDGIDKDNDVITNYFYDLENGNSSGRIISKPSFGFPSPVVFDIYNSEYIKHTFDELNNQDPVYIRERDKKGKGRKLCL